jgi:hypothetical protein
MPTLAAGMPTLAKDVACGRDRACHGAPARPIGLSGLGLGTSLDPISRLPAGFNAHSSGGRGSGLVQYVFRPPARIPAAEPVRRGLCAAPPGEKRYRFCKRCVYPQYRDDILGPAEWLTGCRDGCHILETICFNSCNSGVSNPSVNQSLIGLNSSSASLRYPRSARWDARPNAARNSHIRAC